MPKLGETMEHGVVVDWLITEGANYRRGEILLEIETDKTIAEVPALGDGTLLEILAQQGATVPVGGPIARVRERGKQYPTSGKPRGKGEERASGEAEAVKPQESAARFKDNGLRATPAARRLAREGNLQLASIAGTGRRGRIDSSDVKAALADGDDHASASLRPSELKFAHGIAHVTAGSKHAKPVLLLHGFAGDHTSSIALAIALAKRCCHVVSVDLPGHGETRLEARTSDDLSSNLAQLVESVFEGRPVAVCAHSLGTLAALALAETVSLSSLTLLAPAGLGAPINPAFITGMARPSDRDDLAELLSLLTVEMQAFSPKAVDAIYATQAKGRLIELAKSQKKNERGEAARAKLAELATKLPVRILQGQKDAILDWENVTQLSPRISLHLFPEVGHTPQWEAFNETLAVLLEQVKAG